MTRDGIDRVCGGCTLCCVATAVESLRKPCGVACAHLRESGCGIYGQRTEPKYAICVSFECEWKQGWGTDDDRPDRLGVLLQLKPDPDNADAPRVHVTEKHPGAAGTPRAMRHIQDFLKAGRSVVVENAEYAVAFAPNGDSWHYTIDESDPLRSRVDPSRAPVQLTSRGKPLISSD